MSDSVRPHRRQPPRLPRPWDSPGKNTGVGCHFLLQCMKVKSESEVTQSCPTLRDRMDCSLPGSSIHGIFQARVLEWVGIAFSFFFLGSHQTVLWPNNQQLSSLNTLIPLDWFRRPESPFANGWTTFLRPFFPLLFIEIVSAGYFLFRSSKKAQRNPQETLSLSHRKLSFILSSLLTIWGFPGGSDGKESVCSAGDLGSIPGLGRSLEEGNGYPLQYSCLDNPMDRGAWWATVHGVARSWTRLSD